MHLYKFLFGSTLLFHQPSCSLPLLPPGIVCEFVCSSLLMMRCSSVYLNTPVSVGRELVLKQGNCPITGWGYVHRLWGVPTVWPVGYTAVTSWLHWGVSHLNTTFSPINGGSPAMYIWRNLHNILTSGGVHQSCGCVVQVNTLEVETLLYLLHYLLVQQHLKCTQHHKWSQSHKMNLFSPW